MTKPVQSAGPAPPGPPTRSGRTELARVWARALSTTACVPRAHHEIERLLRDLLDELFDSIAGEKFTPGPAREVGVWLVTENFTGEQSLSRTVEVLGQALPVQPELRHVDRLAGKVVSLLSALAAGFAAALRARTLEQQEQVKLALFRARQDAEHGLRISEARFRELFTSAAIGIAISDLGGTMKEVNQALGEIIGDPAAELVGRSVYELLHPGDVGPFRAAYQDLLSRQRARFRLPQPVRLVDKEGEPIWGHLAGSLLHDAEGEPTHQVTIVADVTDLHLLAERGSDHQWAFVDPHSDTNHRDTNHRDTNHRDTNHRDTNHRDTNHRAQCGLAAAMPGAWERGEISLDYQPLARLTDQTVVGIQALLRWDHPYRGPLPHQECMGLAARTGLARPLGQWMLHQACEQLAGWQRGRREPAPPLHVDLTPQHAHDPDLVAGVWCALNRAGLAPDRLQIGMPVSALEAENGEAAQNLQLLAEMGIAIALLECSGACAVAHLEDLPVRAVELAPRLVRRVTTRGGDSPVARSVAPLVHLMQCCGATVIVRGIDAQDQVAWWRSAGADVGQGGFFAPPGPPEVIAALLDPHSPNVR